MRQLGVVRLHTTCLPDVPRPAVATAPPRPFLPPHRPHQPTPGSGQEARHWSEHSWNAVGTLGVRLAGEQLLSGAVVCPFLRPQTATTLTPPHGHSTPPAVPFGQGTSDATSAGADHMAWNRGEGCTALCGGEKERERWKGVMEIQNDGTYPHFVPLSAVIIANTCTHTCMPPSKKGHTWIAGGEAG